MEEQRLCTLESVSEKLRMTTIEKTTVEKLRPEIVSSGCKEAIRIVDAQIEALQDEITRF